MFSYMILNLNKMWNKTRDRMPIYLNKYFSVNRTIGKLISMVKTSRQSMIIILNIANDDPYYFC